MEPSKREEFNAFINEKFEEIAKLFLENNEGDGRNSDILDHFRPKAKNLYPDLYSTDPYAAMYSGTT